MSAVRTRFAPSAPLRPVTCTSAGCGRPLFNWLFARHHGGQFVLRIDDTDRQRNLDAALGPILDAFRWLGLDWDEGPEVGGEYGPYFQSQRGELYREAVARLLESGAAYHDFESPDDIKTQREAAQKEKGDVSEFARVARAIRRRRARGQSGGRRAARDSVCWWIAHAQCPSGTMYGGKLNGTAA